MASIYDIKPRFQALLRPLSDALARMGVTANQVTLAALLISIVTGSAIALYPDQSWPLLSMVAVLFIRMALNAIDGMLAREHNMQSSLGVFLNELGDVVSDIALYLPLALLPGVPAMLIVLLVIASFLTEMAGILAVMINTTRRYDGPMGKSDRAFVFGLLALLFGLGIEPGNWSTAVFGLMLLLALLTVFRRAAAALKAQAGEAA